MQLHTLQNMIQTVYELDMIYDVNEFLVTDRHFAKCYGKSYEPWEQLIFRQSEGDTELSLFLDQRVLRALDEFDGNNVSLNLLCMAVEGVSHFVHFCWKTEYQIGTSLLELELQAEVDKYVLLSDLLGPEGLRQRLFEEFSLHPDMPVECCDRYRSANRLAAKYCSILESRYVHPRKAGEMFNELRRFCRRSQEQKISKIESSYS